MKGFKRDFRSLLADALLSGFTINANDREFAIHTLIFGARSPFFTAIFINSMMEKKECKATLERICAKVFEAIFRFIYYGNEYSISDLAKNL